MPASSLFDSPGAECVVGALTPNDAPDGTRKFPWSDILSADLRVGDAEPIHDWFRRIIGTAEPERRIGQCAVEPNLAVVGYLSWTENVLRECRMQALLTTECELDHFYRHGGPTIYYRLDLDLAKPGPLFAEPVPHIHTNARGAPRFPFRGPTGEFLPISFLEFLYRNHFHEKWLLWAAEESVTDVTSDQFDALVESFKSGTIERRLNELALPLSALREVLSLRKRERLPNPKELPGCCTDLTA